MSPQRQTAAFHRPMAETSRWMQAVPEAFRDALFEAAQVISLEPGQQLFLRGDPFDGIYCIVRGALRITGSTAAGKEALLTFVEPCNWFGEVALFDRRERTHDVRAYLPSTILRVPDQALDAMLERHPGWWRWFGLLLSGKMRFAFIALEEQALLPAPQRTARRLVMMAQGYGELAGHSRRMLPVSQEQLAFMLTLSRQTLNQVLRDFQARGLVALHYREIEVVDLAGLARAGGLP
jgi:CRP/FNR family cyclic AMP-dependent transcriptional regulator